MKTQPMKMKGTLERRQHNRKSDEVKEQAKSEHYRLVAQHKRKQP